MPISPVTMAEAEAARQEIDAEVEAMNDKLAEIFNGQAGPIIVQAVCDAIMAVAAQEHENRDAIELKLRCMVAMVRHLPPGSIDFEGLDAYLNSPECLALQERILANPNDPNGGLDG